MFVLISYGAKGTKRTDQFTSSLQWNTLVGSNTTEIAATQFTPKSNVSRMLTRRRSKLQRVAVEEEVKDDPPPAVNLEPVGDLSDLCLELIFSFLDTPDLLNATQVCRRWRDLGGSKRLWSSRSLKYTPRSPQGDWAVVRLLRRSHGIVPFVNLSVALSDTRRPRVHFADKGDTLGIVTCSRLMVVLALRHLVKDTVLRLCLTEDSPFSDVEALVIWETIASKTWLKSLTVFVYIKNSTLVAANFNWTQKGSLRSLWLVTQYTSEMKADAFRPLRSLLDVQRDQLTAVNVQINRQEEIPMEPGWRFYVSGPSSDDRIVDSCVIVSRMLAKQSWFSSVNLLQVVLSWKEIPCATSEQLLGLVGNFDHLLWVELRGMCGALSDPERGPDALRSLFTALDRVQELTLDVDPGTFPLHALLPDTTAGNTSEPVPVPASLRLLVLGKETMSKRPCDSAWLRQLSRVMDASPQLHVQLEGKILQVSVSFGLRRGTIILPHPLQFCQHCSRVPWEKAAKYAEMYIQDLCQE